MLLWIVDKRPLVNKTYPDGVIKSPGLNALRFQFGTQLSVLL